MENEIRFDFYTVTAKWKMYLYFDVQFAILSLICGFIAPFSFSCSLSSLAGHHERFACWGLVRFLRRFNADVECFDRSTFIGMIYNGIPFVSVHYHNFPFLFFQCHGRCIASPRSLLVSYVFFSLCFAVYWYRKRWTALLGIVWLMICITDLFKLRLFVVFFEVAFPLPWMHSFLLQTWECWEFVNVSGKMMGISYEVVEEAVVLSFWANYHNLDDLRSQFTITKILVAFWEYFQNWSKMRFLFFVSFLPVELWFFETNLAFAVLCAQAIDFLLCCFIIWTFEYFQKGT